MKPAYLHLSKAAPMISVMRGIKAQLDPNNILNPGKVLPPETS
jgi:FAD/FMN-containing dehydrogenase